ncbi:MAG: T9SS type A sorting domain-containing protein [Cytophagales bacterium]|nr:T9SS type A sorting domain-containing protein [Cytophagales bacterium]
MKKTILLICVIFLNLCNLCNNPCSAQIIEIFTITQPPLLEDSIIGTNISCFGGSNGTAQVMPSGGTSPYTYGWSGGATPLLATNFNLPADTHTVTVTDSNGCTVTDSIILTEPALLTTTISSTQDSGICNGTATANPSGGASPYNFWWNGSSGNQTETGLCTDSTLILMVWDNNSCTAYDTVTISLISLPLTITVTGTDVTCYGGSDGAADLTVTGGVAPYFYLWSNDSTIQDLTGIPAGTYIISVTDSDTLPATVYDAITIVEPPALTISILGIDATCNGCNDGSANLSVSGGSPPYSYLWSTGDTTQDIAFSLLAGTYTVTVTDSNSCIAIDNVTISEPSPVSITVTITDISCNGVCEGAATVTPSGGTAPYNFFWSTGQTDTATVTATATSLCAGNYSIIITDAVANTVSGTITISEPDTITITITTTTAICGTATATATATVSGGTPPYNYVWSSGDTTETDSSLAAGLHFITVTDTNGCIAYGTATVSDVGAPVISDSITDVTCNGAADGAISISATGDTTDGNSYVWSNGSASQILTNLIGGIYEVTVTGNLSGCVSTASFTIFEPDPITLTVNTVDASCGNADGIASVNVTGGTGTYTYFWSTGGTNSFETGLAAGVYAVNVMDANGCMSISPVIINNLGGPVITMNLQTNTSCGSPSGGAIDINVTGGALPYTYLWSNGLTTQDINNLTDTSYNVIITDSNGCIGSESFSISQKLPLSQAICIVTVDSATGKNLIVWEKNPDPSFYNIYKEGSAANVYFLLASVPYDSVSTFLDILADPKQRSWRYKITAVDSCGNESALSQLHKTMHLTMNLGLGGVINLIWDHYEGFNFGTYYIYRGTLASPSLDSIYAIASNNHSWTDLNPPVTPELFYQVAAVHPTECSPTFLTLGALGTPDQKKVLVYNSARSNVSNRLIPTGINLQSSPAFGGIQLKVYPNPYTSQTEVTYFLNEKANVSLEVYNILGKKIEMLVDEEQISGKYRYSFSAKDLGYSSGVYILKLIVGDRVLLKQLLEY